MGNLNLNLKLHSFILILVESPVLLLCWVFSGMTVVILDDSLAVIGCYFVLAVFVMPVNQDWRTHLFCSQVKYKSLLYPMMIKIIENGSLVMSDNYHLSIYYV